MSSDLFSSFWNPVLTKNPVVASQILLNKYIFGIKMINYTLAAAL